jgi:predicted nucleotidyltransferase
MDKSTVIALVKRYADAVISEMSVTQVIIFGSYVTGKAHEDSDIDVAVVVKEIDGDYLTLITRLYAISTPIDPMIEPHLLSGNGNNGGFLQEVQRTGEVIYHAA